MVGSIAINKIDAESAKMIDLAQKMWDTPETAYNEVNACKWTAEILKEYGFEVTVGAFNLPTCVVGRYGSGHPVIGLLGELDALPGLSQKVQTTKEAVCEGAPGQGCGHNLLNVACLAGAIGVKEEMEKTGMAGTIIFYGCPAEEVLTGKVFMAREGAFNELDACFAWHGNAFNMTANSVSNGLNSAIFHFKGRTAHAGGDPHNGRSALDAAELMSVGANYLREHVTSDIRIHYSYKEAGTAPNIVPDKAAVWYYVRGLSRENIENTYDRLVKVAEGAAHMTETELEIEFLGGCYNTMPCTYMSKLATEAMNEIGVPTYTEEELKFADELNHNSPRFEALQNDPVLKNGPIYNIVKPYEWDTTVGGGSTDVADVMAICPTTMIRTATYNYAAPGHSWQIAACAGMSIGYKGMLFGAKACAVSALKMFADPKHLEEAKKEWNQLMAGRTYKCPIPKEIPIPQPVAK
ncbi:MAG: amidohydrolase [Firmicutes bacterium]|nr:amidohydrolase [Bacillota bacterium]